ncbi:unnamed protein product [Boreogadus saida]
MRNRTESKTHRDTQGRIQGTSANFPWIRQALPLCMFGLLSVFHVCDSSQRAPDVAKPGLMYSVSDVD